nr:MAG TPA: hypothetical protein [Bacteriophage sp.]
MARSRRCSGVILLDDFRPPNERLAPIIALIQPMISALRSNKASARFVAPLQSPRLFRGLVLAPCAFSQSCVHCSGLLLTRLPSRVSS